MRVMVTDSLEPPADLEEAELGDLATVEILPRLSKEEFEEALGEADGIIVYHEVVLTRATIEKLRRCRVIVRGGVGYDNVDIDAAGELGIPVCNIPDYGVDEVADHTIAQILSLNGRAALVERRLKKTLHPWSRDAVGPVKRLAGSTLGIIGCGRIGSAVAVRARALKMNVLIADPYLTPGYEKVLDAQLCTLERVLGESDFVTVHTPLTDETRHLIDRQALAMMRDDAMLVNTSRGDVVQTDAVADALEAGDLGGASIDVLPVEPATPDAKLIQLWQQSRDDINLVVTPHIAYYSTESCREIRVKGAQEVARVLRGELPRNRVN